MEIQSLVRSGKMQRIKSNLHAAKPAPAPPARPLDRKISINSGGTLPWLLPPRLLCSVQSLRHALQCMYLLSLLSVVTGDRCADKA